MPFQTTAASCRECGTRKRHWTLEFVLCGNLAWWPGRVLAESASACQPHDHLHWHGARNPSSKQCLSVHLPFVRRPGPDSCKNRNPVSKLLSLRTVRSRLLERSPPEQQAGGWSCGTFQHCWTASRPGFSAIWVDWCRDLFT